MDSVTIKALDKNGQNGFFVRGKDTTFNSPKLTMLFDFRHCSIALGLALLVNPIAGRFHGDLRRPSPKQKHDSRRDLFRGLDRTLNNRDLNQIRRTPEITSCIESNFTKIHAPRENIWAGLTDSEAASLLKWLFSQSDLNLTTTSSAGDWDNSMYL
jgi:hypothetical protein